MGALGVEIGFYPGGDPVDDLDIEQVRAVDALITIGGDFLSLWLTLLCTHARVPP